VSTIDAQDVGNKNWQKVRKGLITLVIRTDVGGGTWVDARDRRRVCRGEGKGAKTNGGSIPPAGRGKGRRKGNRSGLCRTIGRKSNIDARGKRLRSMGGGGKVVGGKSRLL